MADWKNRIVGQGVKRASEFLAHPDNWRVHPQHQRDAVRGSLDELGWIQQVIENKTTGRLIDGHERIWQALDHDDAEVPYLLVELSEDEERLALATLDPLAALAQTDIVKLKALTANLPVKSPQLQAMIDKLRRAPGEVNADPGQPYVGAKYAVLIMCEDEADQVAKLERFMSEGLTCRALLS